MTKLTKMGPPKQRIRNDHSHYIVGGKVECDGPGFDNCKAAQQRQAQLDGKKKKR